MTTLSALDLDAMHTLTWMRVNQALDSARAAGLVAEANAMAGALAEHNPDRFGDPCPSCRKPWPCGTVTMILPD